MKRPEWLEEVHEDVGMIRKFKKMYGEVDVMIDIVSSTERLLAHIDELREMLQMSTNCYDMEQDAQKLLDRQAPPETKGAEDDQEIRKDQ